MPIRNNESTDYHAVVNNSWPLVCSAAHIRHCSIPQDGASIGLAILELNERDQNERALLRRYESGRPV